MKEIPYPFSTKEEFESNIKEPIGKNWNPETAFERLILPQVVTKLGTTIEPISKEMLSGSSQNANDKYRMIQRNSLPL